MIVLWFSPGSSQSLCQVSLSASSSLKLWLRESTASILLCDIWPKPGLTCAWILKKWLNFCFQVKGIQTVKIERLYRQSPSPVFPVTGCTQPYLTAVVSHMWILTETPEKILLQSFFFFLKDHFGVSVLEHKNIFLWLALKKNIKVAISALGKELLLGWAFLILQNLFKGYLLSFAKDLKNWSVKKCILPLNHQLESNCGVLVVNGSDSSFSLWKASAIPMQTVEKWPWTVTHGAGWCPAGCPCSGEAQGVSSSTFPSSCQCCQHWSVRKDFSWSNFEATFWHPQQTNCCLLPLRALWSPNELVSSQEMRKGTHKINLSGYYALSSAKTKTC